MSSLTWLDYSERERQQVMEVIDLFREEGTRDELGIGTIRDSLSDTLFPGTSTIQTRLRYFFFVPWVMGELERRRISSHEAAPGSRRLQGRLRDALMAGGDNEGVIGSFAGHQVKRLPTSVYWNGLGVWGVRLYPGSEAAYYQSLDGFYDRRRTNRGSTDGEPGKEAELANWDPALPPPPTGLLDEMDFALTEAEADYLMDRVRRRAPDSLLRELVDRQARVGRKVAFPWDHPAAEDLPPKPADALTHAHNFSQLIHGAALLYNLILSEASHWEEGVDDYRSRLTVWWDETVERADAFARWDQKTFWEFLARTGARITPHTRSFVDTWRERFEQATRLESLIDAAAIHDLITARERRLKGKRARIGDQRAMETWSGASGTGQLDYRWNGPVAGYLNDLAAAFPGGGHHA